MSGRIPYPTLHGGLTPDDLPYGYSAYDSVFGDNAGYELMVVGSEESEEHRLVIMLALSPGRYVPVTMVSAGWDVERASEACINAFTAVRAPDVPLCGAPQTGSARAPDVGAHNREAC